MAYQQQAPYTSVRMSNVCPVDTFEKRARGGSRPMLSKEYADLVGSAADEVRMAGVVSGVAGQAISTTYTTAGTFTGADDAVIDAALWDTPAGYSTHLISSNMARRTNGSLTGNILKSTAIDLATFDTSKTYTIKCKFVVPATGTGFRQYCLYALMDTAAPAFFQTGSVRLRIACTLGAGVIASTLSLDQYSSASVSGWASTASFNLPSSGTYYMVLRVEPNSVFFYIQDSTQVTTYSYGGRGRSYASTGNRIGFAVGYATATDGTHGLMDDFAVEYYALATSLANTLVVWSLDKLRYSVANGTLTEASLGSPALTLGKDKVIQCVDRAGVLYIADTDNNTYYGTGTLKNITDGDTIDRLQWSGAPADYSAAGRYTAADFAVEVLVGATEVAVGRYTIASVASNGIQLTGITVTADRTITFKIARSPKKMALSDHTLALWTATAGTIPLGSEQICRYRDSIVFSNFPEAAHMSVMSRAGDPNDWDYGGDDDDVGRAVVITDADAGDIGEPILATVAGGDDYLFYGCRKSLWVMIGDIRSGGGIFNRSREIGIVSRTAYCYGPGGEVFFLGSDGMYWIEPTSTYPQNISSGIIPAELVGLNPLTKTLLMAFDSYGGRIHVYLADTTSTTASTHFWFDWLSKTFWDVSMPPGMEPTALANYPEIRARSSVVLAGRDGYLRTFGDNAATDDGQSLSSYVWIGPIRIAPVGFEGSIDELVGILDNSSGDVTWEIYVGDSMELALAASSRTTGTWVAGSNHVARVRERGHALFVKLSSTSRWAVEAIGAQFSTLGRLRPR
jgi:hypothetical protein